MPLSHRRALNPSISGTEQSSQYSARRAHGLSTCSEEKLYDLSAGVVRDRRNTNKSKAINSDERTPRLRAAKDSTRRQTMAPSEISVTGSKRESVSLCCAKYDIIISLVAFHEIVMKKKPNCTHTEQVLNHLPIDLSLILFSALDHNSVNFY